MTRSEADAGWRAALWRFAGVAFVLGGAAWFAGAAVVQALLPAWRAVIERVDTDHRVLALELEQAGADRVVRLTVTRVRYIVVGGRALEPHPLGRGEASTLAGHTLATITLLFAAAFALPSAGMAALLARAVAAALAAFACGLVDTPLVLVAQIDGLYRDAFEPGSWSPWGAWVGFLDGGGRHALAGACGLLVGSRIGRPG